MRISQSDVPPSRPGAAGARLSFGKLASTGALAALLACTCPVNARAAEGNTARIAFRIPSQPLDEALLALAQQADVQLAAAGDLDRARRSAEVSGVMSVDAALARLLAGTGYTYVLRPDGVVTVMRAGTRESAMPAAARTVTAPATTELTKVVVSARRRDERWIDVPMAVSVLEAPDMEALGLDNVVDALALVPGVTAIDNGAAFTQVQIRGVSSSLGGNDNGYYLDDMPFTGVTVPWHPDTRVYDAERVEVLKGPQGTLFGEGSMGGTVRIFTRAPELDGFAASLQTGLSSIHGGGTGGAIRAMANVPLARDTLALRAVVTRELLPGWVDVPDGERDINEQRIRTQRLRLRWSPDDRWLTDINLTRMETDAPGGDYAADNLLQSDLRLATHSLWRSAGLSSQYALPGSRLVFLHSRAHLDTRMAGSITPTSVLNGALLIEADNTELRWASTGSESVDWLLGLSHRTARRRDNFDADGDRATETSTNRAFALFGETTVRMPQAPWSATAGLRYFREDISTHARLDDADLGTEVRADRWIPRLSVGWHVSDTGLAYASMATGFRSGQVQPITSLARAVAAGIDVPIAIEPDTLVSYELGFKRLLAEGRLRMQGAVFHSRWRDLPVRVPIDDVYNALANSDGARIQGAELEVRYLPMERLDLSLGATFSDARYTSDVADTPIRRGMAVYNVPRVSLAGSARYAWQVRSNVASFAATLRHHSRRKTGLLGRDYTGDPITALDLRFGLESLRWGWFVYGDNLTNEQGAIGGRTTFDEATRLRPRNMGLEVQYRY